MMLHENSHREKSENHKKTSGQAHRGSFSDHLSPLYPSVALIFERESPESRVSGAHAEKQFAEKLEAAPEIYDHVVITELSIPERPTLAPPHSLDMMLTFRNVHNWVNGNYAPDMFLAMHRALKPGGILALVEHRAAADTPRDEVPDQGYMTEQHVIELAESAGFVLEEKSEINANPGDTRDHPEGVWSLQPSYRSCRGLEEPEMNACIERFGAIGESDRMTLRFRKP